MGVAARLLRALGRGAEGGAARRVPPRAPWELPGVGSALALAAEGGPARLHAFVHARHRRLGPLFRMRLGPVEGVFVADAQALRRAFALEGPRPRGILPEAWLLYNRLFGAKRGLFFMDGDEWFQNRSIMNKLILRTNNMDAIAPACDIVVSDLIERWRMSCGKVLPSLDDELYLWSLEVMVSILLGPCYRDHRSELLPAMKHISSVVRAIFEHTSRLSLMPAQLAYSLGLAPWKDFVAAVDETLSSANAFVEQLLSLRKSNGNGLLDRMSEEGLDLKIMQRIIADFILAAGDTTVYTLQWALYELAKNPQLQDEIYEQSLLVNDAKEMSQLSLARWTLREALRLYPVAIFLTRYLPEECELAGYKIEAGTLVMMSLYTSGRDENNFPEAETFWPQRWDRNEQGSYYGVKTPYGSIPFAMGSRSCIGRRIAETQLTLTIAQLMKNFRMEVVNSKPVELTLRMIAVPSEPLQIKLMSR